MPLEGEFGPQGVVSCLWVSFDELDEQMPSNLVLHWSLLWLEHDEELRSPEYPDPSRHLLNIGADVIADPFYRGQPAMLLLLGTIWMISWVWSMWF